MFKSGTYKDFNRLGGFNINGNSVTRRKNQIRPSNLAMKRSTCYEALSPIHDYQVGMHNQVQVHNLLFQMPQMKRKPFTAFHKTESQLQAQRKISSKMRLHVRAD